MKKKTLFLMLVLTFLYSIACAAQGDFVWEFATGDVVNSSPAVSGGYVYVGSWNGKVYCLNAETGVKKWEFATEDSVTGDWINSSPAVVEGYVYVGSWNGKVYCLNAATGVKKWEFATDDSVWSSPAVSGGYVYVGSDDTKVYCLNAATGVKEWEFATDDFVESSPAVSGGYVYVGSWDGYIYCLNAETGDFVWEFATGDVVNSSPAVSGGYVYVGSWDDYIYCLNAETGDFVWEYLTSDDVDSSSPAVSGGYVYVGSWDGYVYCLNAETGDFVWEYLTKGFEIMSSPAVSGGYVYVGDNDAYDEGGGYVYCLNATTGVKEWEYKTNGSDVTSSPAVSGGNVYVGDNSGYVYALEAATGDSGSWPMFRGNPERTGAIIIDTDNDLISDDIDNCPNICNPNQLDADSDGTGDVCDDTPGCGGCGEDVCEVACVRFVDNGDGTVTDTSTGLIWLKDASCIGGSWSYTTAIVAGLHSSAAYNCGLSDGSVAGDWRLPTKDELQSLGTNPPATWYDGLPSETWTMPDAPFTDVPYWYYWSSEGLVDNIYGAWALSIFNGETLGSYIEDSNYVWPVRSDN